MEIRKPLPKSRLFLYILRVAPKIAAGLVLPGDDLGVFPMSRLLV
jgi:hypothetical protein